MSAEFADIEAALLDLLESEFGSGTIDTENVDVASIDVGRGMLAPAAAYSVEDFDFRQQRITYSWAVVFRREAGTGTNAARDALNESFANVRKAINVAQPVVDLGGVSLVEFVHRASVASTIVLADKAGGSVVGEMIIETIVHRSADTPT